MRGNASAPDEERSRERLQRAVSEGYRIGRLIGRGGFADVFEADDPRLDRQVAIKVIRPDLVPSHELVERFQREARAMARLRHPHIMEIYTVGEAEGVAYFVMPLIRGESLGARLEREGALRPEEAVRILTEAAGALDAAHRVGTVHRDVKPDNILLEGEQARVVIADFGIAKALEMDGGALTGTGVFVGTPRFMSPEQAVGDELDHRSDTYSLGVVAFQMIAGRLPFEAKSAQALVAMHLTEEPPPLWTLCPECPAHVARAVQRCLAKDPGERWESLADMVAALEGGEGVPAAVGLTEARREPTGRSDDVGDGAASFRRIAARAVAALAGGIVLDVVLGLGGVSAWAAVALAALLAVRAARLWREGHEWREILSLRAVPVAPTTHRAPAGSGPDDVAEDAALGRFATLVRGCTADRAMIVKSLADIPRQEQARFPQLRETTETLVYRVKHLARKVVTLEDRIADAARREAQRREAGPGAHAELVAAAHSRHSARVQELNAARDESAAELRACVSRLEDIRDAVTEWDDLERALEPSADLSPSAAEADEGSQRHDREKRQ